MEVQARSDYSGIRFYPSVADARTAYLSDTTIWKLSFDWEDESIRARPLKSSMLRKWSQESVAKLSHLNAYFASSSDDDLFWVNQKITEVNDIDNLVAIWTDEEFVNKFCK